MGKPRKNPPNSAGKGKRKVMQLSQSVSKAKAGQSLKPIDEGQSFLNANSMTEMQLEVDRLKSLVESLNRKVEKEQRLSQFEARLDTVDDLQSQVTVPLATTTVLRANVGSVAAGVQGPDALQNLSISDGMPLNFIAPSISNGVSRAIVDRDEVASLKLKWQYPCAMFVVGYKPSLTVFSAFIKSKWPVLDHISVILHNDGYFLVKCNSEVDVMMLIRGGGGSFMFGKRPVLVRKWDDQFDFKRDILRAVPVWVRLLNLPTKFWGVKSLS